MSQNSNPLNKRVVYAGTGDVFQFANNWKILFHYQAKHTQEDGGEVIDDSRKPYPYGYGRPLEIVIGKKFKVPMWERCVQSMRLKEVAEFPLEVQDLLEYPFVSKQLRDVSKSTTSKGDSHDHSSHHQHKCGAAFLQDGLGYPDLDSWLKDPKPLIFTFELLSVETPQSYNLASWQLTPDAKLASIPVLKEKGNNHFKSGSFSQAYDAYSEALTRVESLMLDARPGDPEWTDLDAKKVTLYLNIAQCKLSLQEYYLAIEAANEVLSREPKNVKALFRRGRARSAIWEFDLARLDFEEVAKLDSSLAKVAQNEVAKLTFLKKEKGKEDAQFCKGIL